MGRETTYTRQLSILLYGICTDEKVHIYFGKREFICLQVIYLPKPPIKLPRPPPAPCCNCRITFCNPGIPPKSVIC